MKSNTLKHSGNDIELQRCPHDEKNPYTMIRNDLIRDQSISPNCRWLLIYLLSNNEQVWTVKISQVVKHVKGFIGRDAVYRIVNEGIEAGYIQRFEYFEDNMKRYKYYISETPKFKKSLRCPEIQYPEPQYPENQGRKEGISKEKTSLRKNISPPLSSPPEKPLPKKVTKKVSLRSEEEDLKIYEKLNETNLSPREKKRICKEYTEQEVIRAVDIAKHQTVKKTYMGLLLNILSNPHQWDTPDKKTQPRALKCEIDPSQAIDLAQQYNEALRQAEKRVIQVKSLTTNKLLEIDLVRVAEFNDKTILDQGNMCIINDGYLSTVSLKSSDFEQDIKRAIAQLR